MREQDRMRETKRMKESERKERERACNFIAGNHPANNITKLLEKIFLLRHCYDMSNILQVSPKITDCAWYY